MTFKPLSPREIIPYIFLTLVLFLCLCFPLGAQTAVTEPDPRLLLALSSQDYPATPGDSYMLSYYASGLGAVTTPLVLDAGYQLKIQNMGSLNARGKTYLQLKNEVEGLVSKNYPLSGASFILTRIGSFSVSVTGETLNPGQREADGLTRVSSFIPGRTGRGSLRFVQVISANGRTQTYDTFLAARTGNNALNPYIRPGDRIVIPPADRLVTVQGEVFRTGVYELLPEEGLKEVIENYGGGFTLEAFPQKIEVLRIDPSTGTSKDFMTIAWDEGESFILENGDQIVVSNRSGNRLSVFFEGAVFAPRESESSPELREEADRITRIPLSFYPGDTLSNAAQNMGGYFTGVSDLRNAYLLRGDTRIPVDIERFLYKKDLSGDILLEGGDVIVIPYRGYYTITGEVAEAGEKPIVEMTRLSSLMDGITAKGSRRIARITSAGGIVTVCDLFQAKRYGDLSHNPYILPGDHIYIPPAGQVIGISGEVYRPGTYEILPDEGLKDLIENYGGGFTLEAFPQKIEILRIDTSTGTSKEFMTIAWDAGAAFKLENGDQIVVSNRSSNRLSVFFEGAVFSPRESESSPELREETNRITRIPLFFYPGDTLSNAAQNMSGYFTGVSDLRNAYLLRGETRIPVDIERFLYKKDLTGDIPLEGGDVIVIPYRGYYTITGEVVEAGERPLLEMTRLSSLMDGITAKGSRRIARITSAGGIVTVCDLFQAQRYGDLSHNPYILPGDRIYIPPAGRVIGISGEVYRPGTYELLPDEGLQELIGLYADGLTLLADDSRIDLTRFDTEKGIPGEKILFSLQESDSIRLLDQDIVQITNKTQNRPVAFFQGALSMQVHGSVEETTADVEGMIKLEYPFYTGETIGTAVRSISGRFIASSDIANAYLLRMGRQIPVDMRKFLYYNDFSEDIPLQNGDTIIIPFFQYFVIVSGAVKNPGRYPYVPDRGQDYYINLAGGIDLLLNNGRGIEITDINNNPILSTSYILPESKIFVPTNQFTAKFNQYGPIITTILTIISTTLSILAVTGAL